jgi:hypothetical protein
MLNKQPKSWTEITVTQFIELMTLDRSLFESPDELNVQIMSILCDSSVEEIEELDFNEYQQILTNLIFSINPPTKQPKVVITTDAGPLHLITDFNIITLGEFIDLENLFTQGYLENFQIILAILYRQKELKKSLLFPDKFEDYGDYIFHRGPLFDNVSINDVYAIIPNYLKWRTELFERYEGLFQSTPDDDYEVEINENDSIIERATKMKEDAKEKNLKKWGWDIFIMRLAGGDSTKFDAVTSMSLMGALNSLSMKKELEME